MGIGLGIDIGGVDDVDPTLNFTSARQTVAESGAALLTIDPGTLWWAPQLGFNLVDQLHKPFDKEFIERNVRQQYEFDERVSSASVSATSQTTENGVEIEISGNIQLIDETQEDVEFTLTVSELGVKFSAS